MSKNIDNRWVSGEQLIDNETIEWANKTGKYLEEIKLTTTSLRRFFGEVRRLQSMEGLTFQEDVRFLQAKLAYDAGRKNPVKKFYEIIIGGLQVAGNDRASFERFVKIIEAIVAFHKFHGGKEN
jgi:CRISPR-associated protein Csm2